MEQSATPTAAPEKTPEKGEDGLHFLNRLLKVAAYPMAAASGLWALQLSIRNDVYHNLKRYHGFDDILEEMRPINDKNVEEARKGLISPQEFLKRSRDTQKTYMELTEKRIQNRFGLGSTIENFPNQWRYVSKSGKTMAVIQGATVTGIALGAMLTMANSKTLIELLNPEKNTDEKSR